MTVIATPKTTRWKRCTNVTVKSTSPAPSLASSTSSGNRSASVSIVCALSSTGGCLATPKIGEREAAAELLAHAARTGALRPGLILIGDKGFAGRDFEDLLSAGFGTRLARPDRRDETPGHGSTGWIRQWIESVNDTLKGQMPDACHDPLLSAQSVSG